MIGEYMDELLEFPVKNSKLKMGKEDPGNNQWAFHESANV